MPAPIRDAAADHAVRPDHHVVGELDLAVDDRRGMDLRHRARMVTRAAGLDVSERRARAENSAGSTLLTDTSVTPGADLEEPEPDRGLARGREVLAELAEQAVHDPARLLDVHVGQEQHDALARHAEYRVVHAQRALDVVDDLREQLVAFEAGEPHHHRAQSVLADKQLRALHELAQAAGVAGVRDLHLGVHRKDISTRGAPGCSRR